jgi:hypothetical protein
LEIEASWVVTASAIIRSDLTELHSPRYVTAPELFPILQHIKKIRPHGY